MLFISEKYYDLYFDEKHIKYFTSMGHVSVRRHEHLMIWVEISIFFTVKSILGIKSCILAILSRFW